MLDKKELKRLKEIGEEITALQEQLSQMPEGPASLNYIDAAKKLLNTSAAELAEFAKKV